MVTKKTTRKKKRKSTVTRHKNIKKLKKSSTKKRATPTVTKVTKKSSLPRSSSKHIFSFHAAKSVPTKKNSPFKKTKSASYTKNSIESKFDKKTVFKKRRLSKIFNEFLEKAGIQSTPKSMLHKLFRIDLFIIIATSIITIFLGFVLGSKPQVVISLLLQTWTIVFLAVYLLSLLILFFYLDIKITNRTRQIEDVLPDFLQLASANISAGMTIDRALWFAVRPRFGVLAHEIEEIAKSTIAGEDLSESLLDFTTKYDSKILKESVNLIVAGIRSGGEVGELLNKISENILDVKLMKKEVSASVMTYVIFIGVSSVLAAPGLFALSGQLLVVIQSIAGNLASSGGASGGGLSISFGSDSISLKDFKIFSVVLLTITAYFAAQIISVIQKGDGRDALKNFPLFTVVSLTGFFFISYVLGLLLGGLF